MPLPPVLTINQHLIYCVQLGVNARLVVASVRTAIAASLRAISVTATTTAEICLMKIEKRVVSLQVFTRIVASKQMICSAPKNQGDWRRRRRRRRWR